MSSISIAAILFSLTAPAPASDGASGDWPQWRGRDRDGISHEKGLLKTWPKDGPKLLWTFEQTGLGYSSPAVVGDRLYTIGATDDTNGNREFVLAIDTTSGKEVWRTQIGDFYKNGWGGGPRGTPTVDGDHVYAEGAAHGLVCLERASGKLVWKKDLKEDFNGQKGFWGYSESVLIDGDKLIATPGGPDGAIIALNKKTGETVWRAKEVTNTAEYASLMVLEAGGERQYVTLFKSGTVAVRAKDGKKLWSSKLGGNNIAPIPTPIIEGNTVYVTSNYSDGTSGLLKITSDAGEFQAEQVYDTSKILRNHHGGVIKVDGHVYGHSNGGRGTWVCVDFKTGKEKWSKESTEKESLDKGSIAYADGSFYCLGEKSAVCVKIAASPEGWKEEARLTLPKQDPARSKRGGIWAHPVIANGKLYLRDQNLLFCYDIKAK